MFGLVLYLLVSFCSLGMSLQKWFDFSLNLNNMSKFLTNFFLTLSLIFIVAGFLFIIYGVAVGALNAQTLSRVVIDERVDTYESICKGEIITTVYADRIETKGTGILADTYDTVRIVDSTASSTRSINF